VSLSEEKTQEVMSLLFSARINIPRAVELLGLRSTEQEWERMKVVFRDHCIATPRTDEHLLMDLNH
jgi:hypothetical protein